MTEIELWIREQAQAIPNSQREREAILREAFRAGQQSVAVKVPIYRMEGCSRD